MNSRKWTVFLSSEARKATRKNRKKRALPQYVLRALKTLMEDIECFGPTLGLQNTEWSHFSALGKNKYHCHLLKSKGGENNSSNKGKGPRYVACWIVEDKKIKIVEVYYVGSHENAPY